MTGYLQVATLPPLPISADRLHIVVHIHRLYTRSGDAGETGLGDGSRVPKTHPRIAALGAVDELNAALGVAVAADPPANTALASVQNTLFDLGAELSLPEAGRRPEAARLSAECVTQLERQIDRATERLEPLTSFILPGGTSAAAALHLARAIGRRAEIEVLRLAEIEPLNPQIAIYLNRLSDLLFALARLANDDGRSDVLWIPARPAEDSR